MRGFFCNTAHGQYRQHGLAPAHNPAQELFYFASLIPALVYRKCSNIAPSSAMDLSGKAKKEEMKDFLKCPWKPGDRSFSPQTGALLGITALSNDNVDTGLEAAGGQSSTWSKRDRLNRAVLRPQGCIPEVPGRQGHLLQQNFFPCLFLGLFFVCCKCTQAPALSFCIRSYGSLPSLQQQQEQTSSA